MDNTIKQKYSTYPAHVREKLLELRSLIVDIVAAEKLGELSESLKWGQLSYVCKKGSPIRLDWSSEEPNHYSIYVNCNSKLISTFKEIYPQQFHYVRNREIQIPLEQRLPKKELYVCLSMALRYHQLKHLPLLGA